MSAQPVPVAMSIVSAEPAPAVPAPPVARDGSMSGAAFLTYELGLAESHYRILAMLEAMLGTYSEAAPHVREAMSVMAARVRRLRRLLAEP